MFDEVRFAVDDDEYGDWQSLEDTEAVQLPSVDGVHVIHMPAGGFRSEAGAPGSEERPSRCSVTTTLDTHGPVTAARDVAVASRQGRRRCGSG